MDYTGELMRGCDTGTEKRMTDWLTERLREEETERLRGEETVLRPPLLAVPIHRQSYLHAAKAVY